MDAAELEARVRTFVDEVWNGRKYNAAADLYGESYSNGLGSGPSAWSEVIRRYHQAFPDLHSNIDELIVAGDTVVMRATFRGTDTGGYVGRAPTGRAGDEWGGHHHALRARQGRERVGWGRQARAVHPTRGGREPVAQLSEPDGDEATVAVGESGPRKFRACVRVKNPGGSAACRGMGEGRTRGRRRRHGAPGCDAQTYLSGCCDGSLYTGRQQGK